MSCSRCECCNGKGTLLGLGCMDKECDNCAGVGYVKVEEAKPKRVRNRSKTCQKTEKSEDVASIPKS